MAIKFSQLPKVTSIETDSLIPIVDIGIGSNVLGVVTGTTFTTYINTTVSSSIATLQDEIDDVVANVSSAQTSINSLISGQVAHSSQIGGIQTQIAAIQANDASFSTSISTLNSGLTGANAAIVTANTALKGYVDSRDTTITSAWTSNAATQQSSIDSLSTSKANLASPTFTGTVVLPSTTAGGHIIPNANVTYNLGSTTGWWNLIYGKSVQAQYADLAEMYLADTAYEVGTVLKIGGEAEVTACNFGSRAVGVVSGNPAYLMNSELANGTPVALKGRVPVKVIGSIKKGDELIASDNGYAIAAIHHSDKVFAVALETNSDVGVKLVEALVL